MTQSMEQFASLWWLWIFNASLQLTFLVIIVAILTSLLRFRSALLLHCLWLIVLAKAFLPPNIHLPADAFPWLAAALPKSVPWNVTIGNQSDEANSVARDLNAF